MFPTEDGRYGEYVEPPEQESPWAAVERLNKRRPTDEERQALNQKAAAQAAVLAAESAKWEQETGNEWWRSYRAQYPDDTFPPEPDRDERDWSRKFTRWQRERTAWEKTRTAPPADSNVPATLKEPASDGVADAPHDQAEKQDSAEEPEVDHAQQPEPDFALIPKWVFDVLVSRPDAAKQPNLWKVVYSYAFHRNKKTGLAWPSVETIHDETGLGESTIRRLRDIAIDLELIRRVPGREGQGWRKHPPRFIVFRPGKKGALHS